MSALETLPGDPGLIHETAQALAAAGEQLAALTDVVYGLRDASWDSLAGHQFATRMAGPPRVFSALARRYQAAAQALHTFAEEFALAQQHSALAADRFDHANDTLAVLEAQAGTAPDEGARARVQVQHAAWDLCRSDAEASWYAALTAYREADRRCAARLAAASQDELTDSWQYATLHAVQSDAGAVSAVGVVPTPWTKAVGVVAGGISTAALVADKVVYGEGSWSGIGAGAALSAVGSGGRVLRYAATAGTSAIGPAERLALGTRLARGARAETRSRLTAWKPSSHVKVQTPSFGADRPGRHVAVAGELSERNVVRWGQVGGRNAYAGLVHGRDQAVKGFEARFANDYRLALGAGPEAQRLLYGAWGVEGGLKAYNKTSSLRARRPDPGDGPA